LCQDKLNSEYATLCRELAAALARKRPSPHIGGKAKTWACGMVYTIGFVNFLFDKSQDPHMHADELCAWFGVAASTRGNKAKQIRDMLRITHFAALKNKNWNRGKKSQRMTRHNPESVK